jgi:hypothetical protein
MKLLSIRFCPTSLYHNTATFNYCGYEFRICNFLSKFKRRYLWEVAQSGPMNRDVSPYPQFYEPRIKSYVAVSHLNSVHASLRAGELGQM